jgi:hypothetical protein
LFTGTEINKVFKIVGLLVLFSHNLPINLTLVCLYFFLTSMEKINYNKQEQNLVDRLLLLVDARLNSHVPARHTGRVTEPATREQLGLLAKLGIYPKWQATRYEADEMICHYRLVLGSVNRIP